MMWGYNTGMGWGWVFGALLLVGLVIVAFVVVRMVASGTAKGGVSAPGGSPQQPAPGKTPRQILDERYAQGEIGTDEYQDRVRVLGTDS